MARRNRTASTEPVVYRQTPGLYFPPPHRPGRSWTPREAPLVVHALDSSGAFVTRRRKPGGRTTVKVRVRDLDTATAEAVARVLGGTASPDPDAPGRLRVHADGPLLVAALLDLAPRLSEKRRANLAATLALVEARNRARS